MKKSIREFLVRVVILCVGLIIAHFGVTLFLLSNLGGDPFNVFIQGIFRSLQKVFSHPLLTHGNVHVAVSVLILIVLLFTDKSYIRVGTLICMICGGPIIDFFTLLLQPLFDAMPALWFRLVTLALGCGILAFGMTLVIRSEAGTGPNDLVAVVISDKLRKKFSIVRVIVDCFFVLIGFLLGGTAGIGTIVCAFLVGPVAGLCMPVSEGIVRSLVIRFGRK